MIQPHKTNKFGKKIVNYFDCNKFQYRCNQTNALKSHKAILSKPREQYKGIQNELLQRQKNLTQAG